MDFPTACDPLLSLLPEARNSDNATLTTHHPDPGSLEQCPSKLLLAADLTPELALGLGGKLVLLYSTSDSFLLPSLNDQMCLLLGIYEGG